LTRYMNSMRYSMAVVELIFQERCVCVCVCVWRLNKLLINVLYEDLQMSAELPVKLWTWSDNTASLAVSHNKEF